MIMVLVCISQNKKNGVVIFRYFVYYFKKKFVRLMIAKNSNLIPIIVGACLAVLVVIVLIAYLIGRRRSRNGYQSV